jgi:P4 family phage/plasmid primase-like protien
VISLDEAAKAWHDAGASVLPAMRGKRPTREWREFQTERATPYGTDWSLHDGFGIVTGYGGFEMLEIEGTAAHLLEPLAARLAAEGFLNRLMSYMERTPSGGIHWVYRLADETTQEGSQKLARDASGKTMIETRGRYAWTVVAPSGGSIHEEIPGGRWELMAGQPGQVPTFTEWEVERIYSVCREFNLLAPPPPEEHRERLQAAPDGSVSPGQDYEARTTWAEILEPLGWRQTPGRAAGRFWTRPGKTQGVSADITPDGNLYVFSSSAYPFEDGRSYTKFGAYALTEHSGDWRAAATALSRAGYGTRQEPVRLVSVPSGGSVPPAPGRPSQGLSGASEAISAATAAAAPPLAITLTEDGNALLVASAATGHFVYVPERRRWLTWDGNRWNPETDDGLVIDFTRDTIRGWVPPPGDEGAAKHKHRSLHMGSVDRVAKALRSSPELRVATERLDSDPYALNTPSGILNLRTGELIPPDPQGWHTRMTGVGVDFDMNAPRWMQFLAETFVGDATLIEFLQRLAGYSCIGEVTHHVLPFLHGTGQNGKSVFLEVMQGVLGDYAGTAPADLLLQTGKEDHYAMAPLAGQRFVVASEVPPTARFHEQRVKMLTGGDRIAGRFMRADFFTWKPTHHLWLAGNHQPTVNSGGDSFWRRLRMIPFVHTVPEDKRDPELARKLIEEEGPAILAWLALGAQRQVQGLAEPETVKMATAGYAQEEDAIGRFLNERVRRGGDPIQCRLNTKIVYAAYEGWCHAEGVKPMPNHVFGREMKQRGIEKKASNGSNYYVKVALLAPEDDQDEHPRQYRFDT